MKAPDRSAELVLEQRALTGMGSLGREASVVETGGIPRRTDAGAAPLSFAQQRLWFLQRLEPNSPAYNMSTAVRLRGPLDLEALRKSFQAVVLRHEVLRTTFTERDDQPVQTVQPPSDFPLSLTDLSAWPGPEREEEARRLAARAAAVPFDLARDRMLRAEVVRLADREHVLLYTIHHIASDAWTVGVLHRELAALYEGFTGGNVAPLPPLPIQYADFSVWQRRRMESETLRRQLAYWKRQLDGAPPLLELPGDRSRPAAPSHRGVETTLVLPERLRAALVALGRQEGGTLFMTLLAAFQLLLARWSGQRDIVVGAPIAGRTHVELEGLIGFFVNSLVMRTDLGGDPTFRQLLARVREAALDAYSNQELPFERLVEELQPERSLTYNPLFQVLFQVENTGRGDLRLPGVEASDFGRFNYASKFDLTLRVHEGPAGLTCICKYNEDLFSLETITHLLEQYETLLEQIVASPEAAVGSYSLLTDRSRSLIPDPGGVLAVPRYPLVTEAFSRVARRTPDHPAIEHDGRAWSYRELAETVDALTAVLRRAGVTRGSVVAVTGPSSPGLVASLLAVLASGGVMVPIAPDLPERRRKLILGASGATHLMLVGNERAWTRELGSIVVVGVDERTGHAAGPGGQGPGVDSVAVPTPDAPAYIFFTSGTSGLPKGVLGVHQGIGHFLDWQCAGFGIGPRDRCAQLTNISFDVMLRDVFLPLWSGATLCLPPEDLTPDRVLAWLELERISVVHVVPSLAQVWLEQRQGRRLPDLRWVFLAGEPLGESLVRTWREVTATCGLVNLYGPTEATMVKCFYRVPQEPRPGVQPAGRPLPHSQALVLSDGNRLCGVNEPGEIVLRTRFITRGYINAPEEQARHFIQNPFRGDPDDVLYRTGDLGRYAPDGTLMVLGRLDQQIKIRGVRIEPEEVASVLARHPGVTACAVVGRETGAGKALIAYVVTRETGTDAAALRGYLAEHLPAALVPSAFVFLDTLPLTANGKLDYRALPDPDPGEAGTDSERAAPRTPLEEALAELWSEVLGVPRVGIHDDFFNLGGHSLLATRVIARLRTALGIELPLRTLFEVPTVSGLAGAIAERLVVARGEVEATSDSRGLQ